MSVSDVFLDAEFKCFQNFSITHTFRIAADYAKAKAYVSYWGSVGGSLDVFNKQSHVMHV